MHLQAMGHGGGTSWLCQLKGWKLEFDTYHVSIHMYTVGIDVLWISIQLIYP